MIIPFAGGFPVGSYDFFSVQQLFSRKYSARKNVSYSKQSLPYEKARKLPSYHHNLSDWLPVSKQGFRTNDYGGLERQDQPAKRGIKGYPGR